MDSFLDFVWQILLDKDIQEKYKHYSSDWMPQPKPEFMNETAWNQLSETIREAFEGWKAQAIKRNEEKEYVLEVGNNHTTL
ncbi:MAG TPA: hypothetical protein VFE98_05345 [Candidatus Bathyarchaeia archaeon]|nr:hypothetical protein [Candidatus Bathyarchaeia archaeon]